MVDAEKSAEGSSKNNFLKKIFQKTFFPATCIRSAPHWEGIKVPFARWCGSLNFTYRGIIWLPHLLDYGTLPVPTAGVHKGEECRRIRQSLLDSGYIAASCSLAHFNLKAGERNARIHEWEPPLVYCGVVFSGAEF